MLLSISASELKPIISAFSKVISPKDPMTIRQCIYLHADELCADRIIATASNETHTLHYVLPLSVCEDFSPVCIPFRQLAEITAAVCDSVFPMELRTGQHASTDNPLEMTIDYGEGQFRFMTEDASGYPVPKMAPLTFQCSVQAKTTFASASNAAGFTAKEELRPVMQGVYFDFRATGELRIVSSDSKMLYLDILKGINVPSDNALLLQPQSIAIINACVGSDAEVPMGSNGKFAVISSDRFRLECVMIEGRYPNYEKVVPKSQSVQVDLQIRQFLTSVRRAAICANSSTNQVRFDFVPSQIYAKVSATDVDFSKASDTSMPLTDPQQVTKAMSIGFRANYLLSAVGCIPGTGMKMCMSEPNRAVTFCSTDESLTIMVMPCMITES